MKRHIQNFNGFLAEAEDPSYYQETFYLTILLSMLKDVGGSRDQTKNDIRAIADVLTVTLVEPEKGGIQRDVGNKYLTSLKIHLRRPKIASKEEMTKLLIAKVNALRGCNVLRFTEWKPKKRRKSFKGMGTYKLSEVDYQKQLKKKSRRYTKKKKRLIGLGKQPNVAPYTKKPSYKRSPSAPPGFGAIGESIRIRIKSYRDELMTFSVQEALNQDIWDGDKRLHPEVRDALMEITADFIDRLDLEIAIKDVIFTGSLANYNWSKFSDIDLHLVVNFADINDNEDLVRKFFNAFRSNWNKKHDVTVKDHEVEIYVQDELEPHISTGVYSIKDDRWLVRPKKVKPEIDRATAKKKSSSLKREIDKAEQLYRKELYEEAVETSARLKEKIKQMRRTGLDREGLYSPENLAFKMLRRSGDIQKLFDIYTSSSDVLLSLAESPEEV